MILSSANRIDHLHEETIRNTLNTYKDEHGTLPIEFSDFKDETIGGLPASSSKCAPTANAKSKAKADATEAKPPEAKPEPQRNAKAKAAHTIEIKEESSSDLDIYFKQMAPISSPKRVSGNLPVLTQNIQVAFHKGLIKGGDLVVCNTLGDATRICKMKDKQEKQRVMNDLNYLFKTYVYEPSLKSFSVSPKSSQNGVKKTNAQESTILYLR